MTGRSALATGLLPAPLRPASPAVAPSPLGVSLPAFQDIYDEHFQFVWRSLRRLGVPESDVPDAAQDVFIVVHRRLDDFEGRSKVSTWLYGICYRVAHDRRRLAHVRRHVDDEAAIEERVDEGADVAAAAERRESIAVLELLLDEMPIEQRAVFTLFELEGLSSEAIAEALEIPLGTVYSRLRLAREQFRRSLARRDAQARFRAQTAGGQR